MLEKENLFCWRAKISYSCLLLVALTDVQVLFSHEMRYKARCFQMLQLKLYKMQKIVYCSFIPIQSNICWILLFAREDVGYCRAEVYVYF